MTLSLVATSTSSQNINFGYADNGGWLKFSVPAGASNSPITVTDTVKATTTRMEVRTALTNGDVTLAQVNMYRGCPTPSPTPLPTLSPTPLPSAPPSAAGGVRTHVRVHTLHALYRDEPRSVLGQGHMSHDYIGTKLDAQQTARRTGSSYGLQETKACPHVCRSLPVEPSVRVSSSKQLRLLLPDCG